ncbi:MAG: triose-phosphate isomerase [Pseudomonadota bacterium]
MGRKIAAGNWKMNGSLAALAELEALTAALPADPPQVIICPPTTLLSAAVACAPMLAFGAQDCHAAAKGAFTGDIAAAMIAETGAGHVILGHSERRAAYGESDATVRAKAEAAHAAGLTAIICLGESLQDREAGTTLDIVGTQLEGSVPDGATADNTVIAYEPIWAIGTGKVPTLAQIVDVHDVLRAGLTKRFGAKAAQATSLLYGGSVKADNAAMIFDAANVDGALVGGASLKAEDFSPIITALAASADR